MPICTMKSSTLVFFYWIFICTIMLMYINSIYGFIVGDNEKCRYLRVEKMLKAQCRGMNLRDVPSYLSTGVEVLDISFNRIKKLKKSAFLRYKDVRYLLLYDNMIHSIEPGTFSNLDSLEEIDLSNNALSTIPLELFNLPSLRNLYVDSNELSKLNDDLNTLEKPITAPLEYLNIADCGLNDIPYFGVLPRLWHLNVSSNPLDQITVQRFSPMCHLKSVDLDKTTMPYCSCQFILMFFGMQKIKAHSNFCDVKLRNKDDTPCHETANMTIFDEDFYTCSAVTATVGSKFKVTWMFIAICMGVGFICLTGLIFCINKRKSRKIRCKNSSSKTTNKIAIESNCSGGKLLENSS